MVAVPLLSPAVLVSIFTVMSAALVCPAPSPVNEPAATTPADEPSTLAFRFSEKPSLAAILLIDTAWATVVSPTRTLPKSMGELSIVGAARR